MPALIITTSPNISVLNSNIVASLCDGNFVIDAKASSFIGSGAAHIKGIKVKIVNPSNVPVKDYSNTYDITDPTMDSFIFDIPTQAGNYQYGKYLVYMTLVDADNKSYEMKPKTVVICEPDPNNKSKKIGTIGAKMEAICNEGKLRVRIDNAPTYRGLVSSTQENDFVLKYPTASEIAPKEFTVVSFSAILFDGEYKVQGTSCATYNDTDNIAYEVKYVVDVTKKAACTIDECCIFQKLSELHQKLSSSCTDKDREYLSSLTLDVLRLLTTAKLAAFCGEDASEYISELEALLQCRCSATTGSTSLVDITPSKDFVIQGCNVTKETVDLTDVYTIENYGYKVTVNPNGGVLIASAQQLQNCEKTTVLSFDINQNYLQIKNLANSTQNEALAWAAIINKSLIGIDPLCLGITQNQWNALTFASKFQTLLTKICGCCGCDAVITTARGWVQQSGSDVVISWTGVTPDTAKINVYLDGNLVATLLGTATGYTFVGAIDGKNHDFVIEPVCNNGTAGVAQIGAFGYVACPHINPPNVSTNNVNGADCPYDLTTLVSGLGLGITAEWHNQNNTSPSTLISDPTQVITGKYFVFAKDSDGCYSAGVEVIVVCAPETSCSAPQNINIMSSGTDTLIRFQSAAFPPPANSYTVKRRLKSAPDISGSYTTIGTPTWNAMTNRWEILDTTIAANTLYVYRVISNCGGGSNPYTDYDYANISCPVVSILHTADSISYSFAPLGGGVDKYTVKLYNATATTLIDTYDHVPAFPNPITHTFNTGIAPDTGYFVVVTVFVGSYSNICDGIRVTTDELSDLPCADILVETYPAEPQNGVNNLFGVRITLDQAYNENITVNGFIMGSESFPATAFSITVPAGTTTIDSGLIYSMSPTEAANASASSIFPEVVTNQGGTDQYSTQCGF